MVNNSPLYNSTFKFQVAHPHQNQLELAPPIIKVSRDCDRQACLTLIRVHAKLQTTSYALRHAVFIHMLLKLFLESYNYLVTIYNKKYLCLSENKVQLLQNNQYCHVVLPNSQSVATLALINLSLSFSPSLAMLTSV